jgi:AAA+ ATPase superfamily predicted ATPase
MALPHLSQAQFEQVLAEHVRPSSPIESFEHLFDREKQLNRIEEALSSPGRHIFIYGDRGAGKTSLAKSAAYKHHPSLSEPVYTACGQRTNFSDIVRDIASQFDHRSAFVSVDRSFSGGAKAAGGGISLETNYSQKESQRDLCGMDLNAATAAIREAVQRQKTTDPKVVVIDEFESLPSIDDRRLFAELVKQLSDRGVHVSLIFCGIGRSLDDLLQGHGSVHRYLEEVKLPSPPLTYSGRWAIIDGACQALGLTINEDSRVRIAQVSDGFPHYVHLIAQKLFWAAFRAEAPVRELTPVAYMDAVREALGSVESRLRNVYDTATKKDQDSYQEVLWSVADHFELERNNRRIYNESYQRVMADVGRPMLSFDDFQKRLTNLKGVRHGSILSSNRRGWIHFSENLIRGYVRLVAESKGVRLALEHEPGPEPKKITAGASVRGVDPSYPRPTYGRPR